MKHELPEITDVEIIPFRPKKGHLGFASFVINGQFYISDVAIFSRLEGGIRLGYPVKRLANGHTVDIFKPLSKEVDKPAESAVAIKYQELLGNV